MSKYLDKVGLEHYHDLIKGGLYEDIVGTQSSATSTWTGVSTQPDLSVGKLIIYHLPYAGASAVPTLNLTLPDGTTTGAKTVGTKAGTYYAAGDNIALRYNGTSWETVDGYPISGAASTIVSSDLTANKALVSNGSGKVATSSVTSTELGYLSGVTSNVQSQFSAKQDKSLSASVAEFLAVDTVEDALRKSNAELKFESIQTSGTWTVPSNVFGGKIFVIVVGGGGSGATAYSSSGGTGGGGGSGHLSWGVIDVTPGQTIQVVIGAGGAGVNAYKTNGNKGGTSSFGNLTAEGGNGGTTGTSTSTSGNGGDGGAGGGGRIGGNASFGGGGGGYLQGGNGGPYGGGGCARTGTGGTGGTYGGNGASGTSTPGSSGTPYMGGHKLWKLAAEYYNVTYPVNNDVTSAVGAGGGGLGGNSPAVGAGGGGFLASSRTDKTHCGGGALFCHDTITSDYWNSGGGGFFAPSYRTSGTTYFLRGGGSSATPANNVSTSSGGNGVVAIWYYIDPIRYLNENF